MRDELKVCPFCGNDHITLSPYTEVISKYTFVKCTMCNTQWMVVSMWNTRPAEAALQSRIDCLETSMAAINDAVERNLSERLDAFANCECLACKRLYFIRANSAPDKKADNGTS